MSDPTLLLDLDRPGFVAWLRGLEPHAIVGERESCGDCVLARYLAWMGAPRPYVTGEEYATDELDRDTYQGTPAWAERFIFGIMGGNEDLPPPTSSPTARECLEVLEGVA